MQYRVLGNTGLRVSELFLGAMTFGEQGGVGAPIEECRRMVDAYADAGGNVIDTAINYRGGQSEEFLGELLAGRRDRFVVSTKFTVTRDAADPNGGGSHRKNLRLSLETSLKRLRTDYIDLYWVHMWDRYTPIEETLAALHDVVRSGHVLHLGISDTPAWVVARANALAECRGQSPFAAIQAPYNLLQRDIETDLLPMAEARGLTVAAWSPLAGGVLSGKFNRSDRSVTPTRLDPASIGDEHRRIAEVVSDVADELGVTAAQVAIRWVMTRSPKMHPILGARRLDQLLDNLAATQVSLPEEARRELESAAPFDPGFPTTFIHATAGWVFGAAGNVS
jgi:aryl-alcohol dehydrogenase-like predicted oxidoreductase